MANTFKFGNGNWATKEGSVLAYNDENNNFKPLPFDFTRASTATYVDSDGLIKTAKQGEARIDFKDDSKGALKLEPARTNYVTSSESITPFFTTDGTTLTQNYDVSPTGENNSVLLTQNTGSVNQSIYNFGLPTTNGDYSYSFFFRAGTSTNVRLYVANAKSENFNPQTVTAGIVNGVNLNLLFEDYGNGWFRVSTTVTLSGASFNRFLIYPDRDDLGRNIEIFGAQYELGSYATSYIPTEGSAVTRLADGCSNENLNVDYSGDYTLYLEHETLSLTEYNQCQFRQETPISYIFRIGNSINIGTNLYTAANTIGFNKFALSVTSIGSYKFYKNGVLLSSGSGLNANLETIKNDALGMSIKEIKLYNTELTDQELIALTQV